MRSQSLRTVTSNGEVEGPAADAGLEPRAHTVPRRPRRHHRASRTPPTIVRLRRQLLQQSREIPATGAHECFVLGVVRRKKSPRGAWKAIACGYVLRPYILIGLPIM